jgi:hypothetical protein
VPVNKAFWAITAVDAALFVFLLVVTLMQPGPSSGGREMALFFSILLPALVLGLAVLLYLFSKSTGLKVTALVVVAGPGLLLAGIYVRSAYIDYLVQRNASGRGYFSVRRCARWEQQSFAAMFRRCKSRLRAST